MKKLLLPIAILMIFSACTTPSEPVNLASTIQTDKLNILFFHASWCPTCKALENQLASNKNDLPENLLITQLDYDTELDLRKKTGCNVIGFKDSNGEYQINPDANQKLIPGSKIIVLGKSKQIQNLNSIYNIDF